MLDDLRTRGEEVPQWEFCDGFLAATVCTRRQVPVAEYLPMLLAGEDELELFDGVSLPKLQAFRDDAQQARFVELFERRMDEVTEQLDAKVQSLDDEMTYSPLALDTRGALLSMPEEERPDAETEIPSFGQIWALGFMYGVECWSDDWQAPRDVEAAGWLNEGLNFIVTLTEDDNDPPEVCMFDENGPASTSKKRVEDFGEAIWAVYDLRQLWRSLGPRQHTVVKGAQPGRNDLCPCGSGKKFKKCHGA